jgi:hypothetical protein
VFLLAALLTSLLSLGPYSQKETQQKAVFLRAKILVRLENREAAGLEQYLRELRRTEPRYRRFQASVQNLQHQPLGTARRETFDLCLGLYEAEIQEVESRLSPVGGKPWAVQGGECYGLLRDGRVRPLDGRVPQKLFLPDPLAQRRFTAVLATWRRAFGTASFEALRAAREPELLPESSVIRNTLRRFPEETGLLRLDADEIDATSKQILLLLCAGLSKEGDREVAEKALLLDLFERLQNPEILARIYRRQGYLPASRVAQLDRYPKVSPIEVAEARDLWSRGPLPRVLDPEGEGAEILTTVLLVVFGGGVLILLLRSFRGISGS